MTSLTRPLSPAFIMKRLKPPLLGPTNRWRQHKLLGVDHNLYESWSWWLSAWASMGRTYSGIFAFSPSTPAASAIFAKSGL